jgi:hypothetical protein
MRRLALLMHGAFLPVSGGLRISEGDKALFTVLV